MNVRKHFRLIFLAGGLLSLGTTGWSQDSLTMLFMGDFMGHDPQIESALRPDGTYDYSGYFEYTEDWLSSVDVVVANLEVTLAGPPFKGYPQFSSPDAYAEAIRDAGVDILTTSNNHSNDRGSKGLERTLDVLDTFGIPHLGTYRNADERSQEYPFILEQNGIRVAILNATYGTNGLATKPPQVVNHLDSIAQLRTDIAAARAKGVDKIIMMAHWGTEYLSLPDKYQKAKCAFLFDQGVDIIIGGHPHWVQPMEWREPGTTDEQLIAWSMGNVVSNQRRVHTDGGMSIQLSLVRNAEGEVVLKDAGYHLHWVWVDKRGAQPQHRIVPLYVAEQGEVPMSESEWAKLNTFATNERALLQEHCLNAHEFMWDSDLKSFFLPESE